MFVFPSIFFFFFSKEHRLQVLIIKSSLRSQNQIFHHRRLVYIYFVFGNTVRRVLLFVYCTRFHVSFVSSNLPFSARIMLHIIVICQNTKRVGIAFISSTHRLNYFSVSEITQVSRHLLTCKHAVSPG